MKLFSRPKKDFIRSPCEVCGYLTHAADERGRFFICDVCFWEDDELHKDLDEPCDGPNHGISVSQAKINFKEFGACREDMISHVRKPKPNEIPYVEHLSEQLANVIDLIERWSDGEESVIDEIEDATFGIIADDEHDKLPEDVQGIVYFLNMHEIETPDVEDFSKARKMLKSYLKSYFRREL